MPSDKTPYHTSKNAENFGFTKYFCFYYFLCSKIRAGFHMKKEAPKQCNRGDMRKIPVTRQFFEASGRHEDFSEKTKNPFLD